MNLVLRQADKGFGGALAWSAGLHLTLFFIMSALDLMTLKPIQLQPTYYVDLTSLPTASPGGGASAPPLPSAASEPEPEPAAETAVPLPVAPRKDSVVERKKEEEAFARRMEQMNRAAEARRQEEVFKKLAGKAASSGSGPAKAGGKGSDPLGGSDYGSYVQSRLRDAFARTIASQSRNPEAVVRLTIDSHGRIIRQRFERSSGDRLFEDAVRRAIALAEKTFPPNPAGEQYENGFLFRPEGVGMR
jgi:colicin import membrane protein